MKKFLSIFMAFVLSFSLATSTLAFEGNEISAPEETKSFEASSLPESDNSISERDGDILKEESVFPSDEHFPSEIDSTTPTEAEPLLPDNSPPEEEAPSQPPASGETNPIDNSEEVVPPEQDTIYSETIGIEGPIENELMPDIMEINADGIAPASITANEYGLFIPLGTSNGDSNSSNWFYVNASDNADQVYRGSKTFAEETIYSRTARPALFGDVINIKPGSYKFTISVAKFTGNESSGMQKFDSEISTAKYWDCTALRGTPTTSYKTFKYAEYSMYPGSWEYLYINNIELGDIIEVSTNYGTFYLVCGPRNSGELSIYEDAENVSKSTLRARLSQSSPSTIDLSAQVSIDGSDYPKANILWSSSDQTIATVSSSGVVTPKKPGTAKITATWNDKYFKCSNYVTMDITENQAPVISAVESSMSSGSATVLATDDFDTMLEYGYSDSKASMPTEWKGSTIFTGLFGMKYFFAKDSEGAVSLPFEKFIFSDSDILDSELVGLRTEYQVGDKVDLDGVTLVLKFSNGDTINIPVTEDMLSSYDNQTPGPEDITVTYGSIVKPATINFSDWRFSVTFPDEIAIQIDKDGTPVAEGEYAIKNNSLQPVKITSAQVLAGGGWDIFDFSAGIGDYPVAVIVLDGVRASITKPTGEDTVAALDMLFPNGDQEIQYFDVLKEKIRDGAEITNPENRKMRNDAYVMAWQNKLNEAFGYLENGLPKLTVSNGGIDTVSLKFSAGQEGASLQILSGELLSMEDNTKALILSINGCSAGENGSVDTSDDSWTIEGGETLPLHINIQVPNQTTLEAGISYKIAKIIWSADWLY